MKRKSISILLSLLLIASGMLFLTPDEVSAQSFSIEGTDTFGISYMGTVSGVCTWQTTYVAPVDCTYIVKINTGGYGTYGTLTGSSGETKSIGTNPNTTATYVLSGNSSSFTITLKSSSYYTGSFTGECSYGKWVADASDAVAAANAAKDAANNAANQASAANTSATNAYNAANSANTNAQAAANNTTFGGGSSAYWSYYGYYKATDALNAANNAASVAQNAVTSGNNATNAANAATSKANDIYNQVTSSTYGLESLNNRITNIQNRIAPQISKVMGAGGATCSKSGGSFSFVVQASGADQYCYSVDSGGYSGWQVSPSFTISLSNGAHTINVKARHSSSPAIEANGVMYAFGL